MKRIGFVLLTAILALALATGCKKKEPEPTPEELMDAPAAVDNTLTNTDAAASDAGGAGTTINEGDASATE